MTTLVKRNFQAITLFNKINSRMAFLLT